MSPEQAEGAAHRSTIGPISTAWGHALRAADLPARVRWATPQEVVRQIVGQEPVPPRQRDPPCRATWRR